VYLGVSVELGRLSVGLCLYVSVSVCNCMCVQLYLFTRAYTHRKLIDGEFISVLLYINGHRHCPVYRTSDLIFFNLWCVNKFFTLHYITSFYTIGCYIYTVRHNYRTHMVFTV